ncbi:unnamed protein product (macronuclear) [Paramecium tetraurelia]|uniref:TNFR-Cys domain-containing protein n=1 Tax=Paramecium tetraurelia TaxID=5888 RepID=A0D038_PARTE|nr:uncharacterized protein GSPATT00011957001 [Paramecium tetraurelia]CAK76405.1 unnamed protein product [Paramecium tetraurelia]|eukprot:XP_001443802.1 hypothetical protein (macronuclear) [Paramecium tetraurelia strain d4-2]
MLFILVALIQMANSEWMLIYSDFYQLLIIKQDSWNSYKTCSDQDREETQTKQCLTNNLEFMRLSDSKSSLEKKFYYPHYQLRIITDVIYIRSKNGINSAFQIQIIDSPGSKQSIFERFYDQISLQEYFKVCDQQCSYTCTLNKKRIEIKTFISDTINHLTPIFTISYCMQFEDKEMRIGLRNILIYANSCHISCASCDGDTKFNCLTCYQGSLIGGVCLCDEANKYAHRLIGCVQECPIDYYIADSSNYCQFDPRIKSMVKYFAFSTISNGDKIPYDPWIYEPDPFHVSNSDMIVTCSGKDQVGKFTYSSSMQLKLPQNEGLVYLRIRASFHFFGWQPTSVLIITVDQYSQMRIEKTMDNYTIVNGKLNIFESLTCSSMNYDFLRIETVLKTYTMAPVIKFYAIQKLDSEFWSFNNVTIDQGLCQSNCTKCETFSKCLICELGFKLFRGTCVNVCPMHSQFNINFCEDYEDLIDNSRYLIKAFYDMNTTFEEVSKVVDNFTYLNNTIQSSFTGAIYSFVPEKSVLGGVLVWSKGKFQKTFINLKPHYQVSFRINFTYGDYNDGWFQYQLDSHQSGQIQNPKNGVKNLVGDYGYETTIFHQHQFTHNSNQLDIILSADTQKTDLDEAFMYVSEYFVVVNYCVPFCSSCTGPTISHCDFGSYTGYNSTHYCRPTEYVKFDSITQSHSCQACNQIGCLECISESVCTRCEFSDSLQFYLDQGECICYPSQYLSTNQCLKCNQYCESCFGSDYDQCYSCNPDFHRSISKFKCQCLVGFYDDGYNLECVPICGDQLIVDGEDCDDGNSNPFDGCDQCKYKCQDECQNCHQGKCYQCKDGFTYEQDVETRRSKEMNNVMMVIIMLQMDVIFVNLYVMLIVLIVIMENVSNVMKLMDGISTLSIIVNKFVEMELQIEIMSNVMTKNSNPFDLCDHCLLGCSEHCIFCYNGICLRCQVGFRQSHKTKQCLPICGDSLIVGYEQCEVGLSEVFHSCNQCKFNCDSNCSLCEYDECLQCEYGYQLRNNKCEQQCGDGLKVGDEECEYIDIYQDVSTGCLSCKQNCGSGCLICTNGICELCKSGYLRDQFKCKPICGDMIIVDPEECEDANLEPYDGCHICNYSCDPQCLTCSFGVCYKMEEPTIVDIDPVEIACPDFCIECKIGNVCIICEEYFQLSDSVCLPICGDGFIISGLEQCEDGNDTPFDGCYQCQFQCSLGCIECEQSNQCRKCDSNQFQLDNQTHKCVIQDVINNINELEPSLFQLSEVRCQINYLLIDNVCINQCGNGELNTEFEICDDGNYLGGDGCSQNCVIEDSYQCLNTQGQLSQCTFINSPQFFLKVLSEKVNSTQIVELTFSQQVKLEADLTLEDLAKFSITPLTNYTLTIYSIQNLSTTLNYPVYHIYIIFEQPIQDPVFEIKISKQAILNEFDLTLQKYEMKINLGNPFILSEETQQKLQSVVKLNEATMYSLIAISGLAIVTGNFVMFFNLLDLLQSLSYLRYMQYQFPPHLIEFLNTYTKVSLQPILDQLQINELFIKLNGGTLPFQQKSNKNLSQTSSLNQFFLINAKSCYFSVITSILIFFACCIASSNQLNTLFYNLSKKFEQNGRILKIIILFQQKVQLSALKFKNEYFSFGIFNVYQAILHQFVFSSFLQFPDYNFNSPFQIFNSINAIISLLFISVTSLYLMSITCTLIKDKQKWKYFLKDSKMEFWAANCKSFLLYRIIVYIFIIVKFIDYPQVQSLLLSMQSFFYLIYLIKFAPLQSPYDLNKLKYREFFFMLITGSLLIYTFEFSKDQQMLFGWIHISMISLLLIINLVIDVSESIKKARINYARLQHQKKLQELNNYYDNPLQRLVFHSCNTPTQKQ